MHTERCVVETLGIVGRAQRGAVTRLGVADAALGRGEPAGVGWNLLQPSPDSHKAHHARMHSTARDPTSPPGRARRFCKGSKGERFFWDSLAPVQTEMMEILRFAAPLHIGELATCPQWPATASNHMQHPAIGARHWTCNSTNTSSLISSKLQNPHTACGRNHVCQRPAHKRLRLHRYRLIFEASGRVPVPSASSGSGGAIAPCSLLFPTCEYTLFIVDGSLSLAIPEFRSLSAVREPCISFLSRDQTLRRALHVAFGFPECSLGIIIASALLLLPWSSILNSCLFQSPLAWLAFCCTPWCGKFAMVGGGVRADTVTQ